MATATPATTRSARSPAGAARPVVLLALLAQVVVAAGLGNAAFQDEALYLATGHWLLREWSGGPPLTTAPEGWFTGAPQLYPVLAAALDDVGGLGLVRSASTAALLVTTAALAWAAGLTVRAVDPTGPWSTTAERDAPRAAAAAAVVAAATGPLLALGHFATFDVPSYACLALALALGLRSARGARTGSGRWWAWAAASGVLLAAATLLKYTSGLAVLPVLVAVAAGAPRGAAAGGGRAGGPRAAAVAAAVGAAVLLLSGLTWGRGLVAGVMDSTLSRTPVAPAPVPALLGQVAADAWLPLLLAALGAGVLAGRRPLLALALGLGAVAPVTAQVVLGEEVSLYKASALGMVLGAVAAAHLVVRLWTRAGGALAAVLVLAAAAVLGVGSAWRLSASWPDTDALRAVVVPLVEERPGLGVAGDNPETMQYALWDRTTSQQWAATYSGAFTYQGLVDTAAFEAALSDGAFGVVFLDGSTAVGRELAPRMGGFGLVEEARVTAPSGTPSWTVWALPR